MSSFKPLVLAVSLFVAPLAAFAHQGPDEWRKGTHSRFDDHRRHGGEHRHFHGIEGDYAWHKEHAHLDTINHIQLHQRQDIRRGLRSGYIRPYEARRLMVQQDAIAADEAYFRRNSQLSHREREHLMQEFRQARADIDQAIRSRG